MAHHSRECVRRPCRRGLNGNVLASPSPRPSPANRTAGIYLPVSCSHICCIARAGCGIVRPRIPCRRSSGVERALGKGEVHSSILCGGTTKTRSFPAVPSNSPTPRTLHISAYECGTLHPYPWKIRGPCSRGVPVPQSRCRWVGAVHRINSGHSKLSRQSARAYLGQPLLFYCVGVWATRRSIEQALSPIFPTSPDFSPYGSGIIREGLGPCQPKPPRLSHSARNGRSRSVICRRSSCASRRRPWDRCS